MKFAKTLMCSTALATMLAGAATAQAVEEAGDTMGNVVEETGDVAGNIVEETGEVVGETVEETGEVVAETGEEITGEGETVVSADSQPIGTVEAVQTLDNGQTAIVVDLDDSLGLEVDQVRVPAQASADGEFALAMSRADFISAVNAQIAAQGG